MNPLVSIIILNYNGEKFLSEVLAHLRKTNYTPIEILVVDNASTDGSVEILKNENDISLIISHENLGFPGGNNLGIRKAKGKYIALVNNDLKVTPDWLNPLIGFLESHPDYAAVQPKILSWSHPDEFEYAGGAGGYIDRFGYPFSRGRILRNCEKDHGQYMSAEDVFWTSGACMVFRKEIIEKVGLMDEDFFLHQEEIDWCWRMLLAGYRLKVIPESVVYHYGGGSLNYDNPRKLYFNYRNNLSMLMKNMELRNLVSILPIRLLLDFAAFFHNIVQGKLRNAFSIVRGYAHVVKHMISIYRKRKQIQEHIRKVNDIDLKPLIYPGSVIISYYLGKKHFSDLKFRK